jgi:HEAT repeat protein
VRYIDEDSEGGQNRVSIENQNGRAYTWKVDQALEILVDEGESVEENQVFASAVHPLLPGIAAFDELDSDALADRFLSSHERTMRFTGVKLARLRGEKAHVSTMRQLADDTEEDLYVRLEALSYLCAVANESVADAFEPYLNSGVDEDALEAVICIGEVGNDAAIRTLDDLVHDPNRPYFLRSASAWALGHIKDEKAQRALIRAFSDQPPGIKEEALGGLVSLGDEAVPHLIGGLESDDPSVAAGCAEALRRYQSLSTQQIERIVSELRTDEPSNWSVWLVGSLPKEKTACRIANMQDIDAKVHYAVSLLWSFSQSWISEHWDKYPLAHRPSTQE